MFKCSLCIPALWQSCNKRNLLSISKHHGFDFLILILGILHPHLLEILVFVLALYCYCNKFPQTHWFKKNMNLLSFSSEDQNFKLKTSAELGLF